MGEKSASLKVYMATIRKRINKDGTHSYLVRIRLKGEKHKNKTFKRLTDAKNWAESIEDPIRINRIYTRSENKSEEIYLKRKKERNDLAIELASSRNRLRNIKGTITSLIDDYSVNSSSDFSNIYPSIPIPNIDGVNECKLIPKCSGIYFLWNGGVIEYVGKSENLSQRLRLGVHHVMKDYHKISYLLINSESLRFAEYYYIGLCKPKLNFGKWSLSLNSSKDHEVSVNSGEQNGY